jgi:hypothetical protein
MERDPVLPTPNHIPAETPPSPKERHAGFFEKWRKKAKRTPELAPPKAATPEKLATPEAPQVERRAFGKEILGLIFGSKPGEQMIPPVAAPEAQAVATPENTPQIERATRMRRFARVVIARVLGEAAQEPTRAARQHERSPLDTHSLIDAAQDLSSAANGLSADIRRPSSRVASLEQKAAERIDDRLRQLEDSAEVSRKASVAAAGLGVLAVILTGAEYFSRRRADREIKRDVSREFKNQEQALERQRIVFDRLRETQARDMGRDERREYYERLSSFTHQQADRTREASRELQEVTAGQEPLARPVERVDDRRERQSRPEVAQVRAAEQPEVAPLVRVENADTIERAPGQQTGSAGTGFFGGGGGGIAQGTGPSDLVRPQQPIDPNSREARRLEELRKLEQARLRQNAWFYGAALIVTMIGAVIAAIVIG